MSSLVRMILVLFVLSLGFISTAAQCGSNGDYRKKGKFPSAANLEEPPDEALKINTGVARVLVKQLIEKRYPVRIPSRFLIGGEDFTESKNVKVTGTSAIFDYETLGGPLTGQKNKRFSHHAVLTFSKLGYAVYGPGENKGDFFCAADYSKEFRAGLDAFFLNNVLTWHDEKDARLFARAYNRLVYDAHKGSSVEDLTAFTTAAAELRKNGAKPPDELEKHRILAEQAVNERDYTGAIQHYEEGFAAYPLWAEGWFNAALLYGELGEYEYAANRMRHYLVLMPDASDAKAAREKVIVWEEKAKQ